MDRIIRIEPHICSDCFRCIRACPVKAIEVVENQATIHYDECTACGECVANCPHEMISIRQDAQMVKRLIKRSDKVVASLHWSWRSEFAGIEEHRIVEALSLLGFDYVSDSTLGNKLYEEKVAEHLRVAMKPRQREDDEQQSKELVISAECPVTVDLIRKRYPELVGNIVPVENPVVLHARMLHEWSGPKSKIVHIGPCVAMKKVADTTQDIEMVITFKELRDWMWDEGVEFDFIPGNQNYRFEPFASTHSIGSTIEKVTPIVSLEGFRRTTATLTQYANSLCKQEQVDSCDEQAAEKRPALTLSEPTYIELWACEGGCIEAVGATSATPLLEKERAYKRQRATADELPASECPFPQIEYSADYAPYPNTRKESQIAESQIERALQEIGKFRPSDYLNCGACGYGSCRDFACAMIENRADKSMCLSYSRTLAQNKFSALLDKIPSGVMLVDQHLKIIEANQIAADIMGPDAQLIFSANEGMKGAQLSKLINFTPILSECIEWNRDQIDQEVQIMGKLYRVSVYAIEANRTMCVVINHMLRNTVIPEEVTARTRAVIRENLEAVQKIAYLLGETASRTEAVLNSIVEQD